MLGCCQTMTMDDLGYAASSTTTRSAAAQACHTGSRHTGLVRVAGAAGGGGVASVWMNGCVVGGLAGWCGCVREATSILTADEFQEQIDAHVARLKAEIKVQQHPTTTYLPTLPPGREAGRC